MSLNDQPTIEQFIQQLQLAVDFQESVELTADTVLQSLPEWDSLAALGVIVMFDSEYGKNISGTDIKKAATIRDLYALLG
ncbi:acyl carrier protein [Herbaspirillum aquaticum]|jgi:acyl carrier protein|uniref:Acyl carrier protein n=1 Tax=Herbaspirillum aquaticum TaxID=568783 RepID=A0A225SUP0_9BURK|nr:acyl carrier protein [Herbaspirillum aquaticum]OWY34832.1 acyl carrier protein [Herbaspirillum aquaticum]